MFVFPQPWMKLVAVIIVAFAISIGTTPIVKAFATKVGAIDVPRDARRVHDHPIPRMGGLAIFLGFLLSVLLFVDITQEVRGILLGLILIVATGILDDIISLNAWVKLFAQLVAALIAILHGVHFIMHPNVFLEGNVINIGWLAYPITLIWIVGITNSVNLIDGLDGLAVGVSTISCITILVAVLLTGGVDPSVPLLIAALAGACIGFMPYNLNPAKIFMGDTGSLMLGYTLATVSVLGLFKFYTIVTFVVPVLALAVPLSDTIFAFFRRILHGQSPFKADRGHFHHKLMDLGLNQKQAVAILYAISAILGLAAVTLTTNGALRILLLLIALVIAVSVWAYIARTVKLHPHAHNSNVTGEKHEKE